MLILLPACFVAVADALAFAFYSQDTSCCAKLTRTDLQPLLLLVLVRKLWSGDLKDYDLVVEIFVFKSDC